MCDSPLLKRALERFLGSRIVSFGQCDIVISDGVREIDKPVMQIGQQLPKPFGRAHLQMALERFCEVENIRHLHHEILTDTAHSPIDRQIETLLKRFADELLTLVKKGRA